METLSDQFVALRERLAAVPVIKSGLSLMTGTMLTSALGLVFWILAARLFEPGAFGVSTTAVYTMIMLADVACLGLRTGLARYLPQAGMATVRTIVWSYALVTAAAAATAGAFLIGLGWWAPELIELRNSLIVLAFFIGSTSFWALFMMQDAVLVGLRKATWVPVENTIFGVLKILLLFPMASLSPSLGVFWAWTLPVFPIVVAVNLGVRRVSKDRMETAEGEGHQDLRSTVTLLRELMTFSLADWLASVAKLAALGIIPLMVLALEGREAAGYFQAPWLIAFTIFALSNNAAYALLAESSYEESGLRRNTIQAGLLSVALTTPVIVVGVAGASLLLLIYGQDFADNSTSVLRILLIAALPNIANQIYIGRLRSMNRMGMVVFLETLLAVLVVGLSAVLLPRFGIDGVGYAWLIGLSVLAAYAITAETVWWWANLLDPRIVRTVGAFVGLSRQGRPARGMDARLDRFRNGTDLAGAATRWSPSARDRQIAVLGNGMTSETMVEFARTPSGAEDLLRHRQELEALHDDPRLAALHPFLPAVRCHGSSPGSEYLALDQPNGRTARELIEAGIDIEALSRVVMEGLRPLRETTGRVVTVHLEDLERWLGPAFDHLQDTGRASTAQLERLAAVLEDDLVGQPVVVGVIHGELGVDNIVLADRVDHEGRLTGSALQGYRQWDRSIDAPLMVDAAAFALSDLVTRSGREMGEVAAELIGDPTSFEGHPAMQYAATTGWHDGGYLGATSTRSVLLLAWLLLVGQPLPPGRTVASDEVWLARNAQPVLATLDRLVEARA